MTAMDDDALYLDGGSEPALAPQPARRRIGAVLAVVVALVAAGGVAAGLVVAGGGSKSPDTKALAKQRVLTALSATTDAGNFDFTYTISSTPPTTPAATTTTTVPPACQAVNGPNGVLPGALSGSSPPATSYCVYASPSMPEQGPKVTGGGTIDTSPLAMVATATIGPDAASGLQVTVRVDSSDVYEDLGNLDGGLVPTGVDASGGGQPLSDFAGITESTLGPLEGPMGMLDMASPTGYLDLSAASVTSASQTGTGTVDGVPVTQYRVTNDPSKLLGAPGLSSEESATISDALTKLHDAGYRGTTVDLSVDGSGYVRQASTVASFADGATATTTATFTDFGCAGTVLMPGQSPTAGAAASCAASSTGPAVTTNPTDTLAPTVPPVTAAPVVPTTLPPSDAPVPSVPTTVPGNSAASTTSTTSTARGG
jgi:hypothetical protein